MTIRATDRSGASLDETFAIAVADQEPEHVEGGDGPDAIGGGALDDEIAGSGGEGFDFLLGGEGDDVYVVDDAYDLVDEGAVFLAFMGGAGDFDTIISRADWFWDVYSVAERLVIADDAVDTGIPGTTIVGSAFSNEMLGNAHANYLFGRGGSDSYRPGAGVDLVSFSTLGLTDDNAYPGVDGVNTLVFEEGNGYDFVFEFEPGKDRIDVTDFHLDETDDVMARGYDDGLGNSYFIFGDGYDYVYFVGLETSAIQAADFIV